MSPKLFNILLILVPAVAYYGYLSPMYEGVPGLIWTPEKSITILKSDNVQYTNTLNQVSLVETEIDKINKDYLAINPDLKASTTRLLPDTINPINLRNEVISIANKAGVAITGLSISPGIKQTTTLGSYSVSFAVTARYPVFKELIQSYERSTRLFILESASLVRVEKKADSDKLGSPITDPEALSSNVIFSVYYLK